jgi:hypothetical protein
MIQSTGPIDLMKTQKEMADEFLNNLKPVNDCSGNWDEEGELGD